jgi:cytochrome c553
MKRLTTLILALSLMVAVPGVMAAQAAPALQEQLLTEGSAALAKAARRQGDASRGALVFHRPALTCTRCHTAGENRTRLGPDLASAGKDATDVYLVESVLLPSKVIKKQRNERRLKTVSLAE